MHLGKPAASARNVTVSFRDYIANVASSEVYPTWPEQALRANIHCQISLALNRIYTEWYPSKGYTFNITNSTSYDQYYVHGRTVFDVMVRLTDDIFNTYIRKTGTVNPYYAEYCDGKSVTCPGLKQWGTVTLANQGRNALSILKYYYGNNIEIIRTNNIQSIPQSYPGSPLRQGSTGAAVFTLQRQLNRITKDYPFLGLLTVDGIFGRKMTETVKKFQKQFNLTDMQFGIGAAERIFGPGGVRVRTQGSAEVEMGLKQSKTKNPSLPERARNRTFFNFDESVQLNVQASVGSKVNFDMNYNTETSFDFDSKKLKLAYTGEEDEIIKSLEAGNVSMTTSNSLINGGAALFGMKADLQFGKLRVNTLFAQQESESKTVSSKGGVQTKPFEIKVDEYDENRHFFLGHYFYDNYDKFMESLPTVTSGIEISKIEVWVTNKRGNYAVSYTHLTLPTNSRV